MTDSATFDRLQQHLAGRYRLDEAVRVAGPVTVYRAMDLRHQRQVAVKLLRAELAGPPDGAERFLAQVSRASRLQHPRILPILDSGAEEGSLYFVEPFVEGETLRERLAREGQLTPAATIRVLTSLSDALAYAHARGVVHGDLSPDTVLSTGRHALLSDVGVVGALAASPPTADDDLRALGALGYQLLTGRVPPAGTPVMELLGEETARQFPAVPAELWDILRRATTPRREDSWDSADALLTAVEAIPVPSAEVTPVEGTPSVARPPAWLVPWVAGVLLVCVTAAAWFSWHLPRSGPARRDQLTFDGGVLEAALAPDGHLLAYVTEADSQVLYVRELAGGESRRLAAATILTGLHWTDHGSRIAFLATEGAGLRLRTVSASGGAVDGPRLPSGVVTLSPDGARAELHREGGDTLQVITLASGDTISIPLQDSLTWTYGVTWEPAGRALALIRTSPERNRSTLWVATLDGRQRRVLADSVSISAPVWSATGDALFYIRGSGANSALMRLPLSRDFGAAGPAAPLANGLGAADANARRISFSGDGRRFVYVQSATASNIVLGQLPGRDTLVTPRPVTQGSAKHYGVHFSPDGHELAYFRSGVDSFLVQTLSLEDGSTDQVGTALEGYDLSWSPDGGTIALTSQRPTQGIAVRLLQRGSLMMRRYVEGRTSAQLTWAGPDRIVHQGAGNRSLWVLHPSTGADSVLPGVTEGWVFSPRASPDGRSIAFAWNQRGRQVLAVLTTGDPVPRVIAQGLLFPMAWSRDGRDVYAREVGVRGLESRVVYEVPARGGVPRVLGEVPVGYQVEDISPDGRTIAATVEDRQADVWQVDLDGRP